jgi:hypothetical protein
MAMPSHAFDKVKAHKPDTKGVHHKKIIRRVMGADQETQRTIYDYLKPIYEPLAPLAPIPLMLPPCTITTEVATPTTLVLKLPLVLVPPTPLPPPPPPQPPPLPPPPWPPKLVPYNDNGVVEAATLLTSFKAAKSRSTNEKNDENKKKDLFLKTSFSPQCADSFKCYGTTVYADDLLHHYNNLKLQLGSESAPKFWHRLAESVGICTSTNSDIAADAARRVHQQVCARFNLYYIPAPYQHDAGSKADKY